MIAAAIALVAGVGGVVAGLHNTRAFHVATDWAASLPNVQLTITWLDRPEHVRLLQRSLLVGVLLILVALLVLASVRWAGWLLLATYGAAVVVLVELSVKGGWVSAQPWVSLALALSALGVVCMLTTSSVAWLRNQ